MENLGYTPFEYWKGPKPVLPGQKRLSLPQKPRRAATIAVTATHPAHRPAAEQQRRTASAASQYPPEKARISVNHEDHPALRGGGISTYTSRMAWPRYGADRSGPASFQVHDANGSTVELVTGRPPSYNSASGLPPGDKSAAMTSTELPWWDPRGWRKRVWAGIAALVVVAIVVGVVAGVLVAKANRYPDYSKLTYTLKDTCKPCHHHHHPH